MTHPRTTAPPRLRRGHRSPPVPRRGVDSFWELATDLFAICGRDGMLYALNPAWERLLGWSREELTTRSLLAFVHPDDVTATVGLLARTHVAGSKLDALVNRWRCRDGSYCTLAWNGASDGDVWCVVGREVTDHAEERQEEERRGGGGEGGAEARVKHRGLDGGSERGGGGIAGADRGRDARAVRERALNARNHLAAVTDSMGEGLLVLDSAGCVTLMNEAAEAMLGWTLADLRGRVLHDIVHYRRPDGSPQPAAASTILQTLELRATIRAEDEIFMRRDGTELPTSYTAAPLVTAEGLEGCVIVFTDATLRQAEQRDCAASSRRSRGPAVCRTRCARSASSSTRNRSSTSRPTRSSSTSCCCGCVSPTATSSVPPPICRSPRSTI